MMRVMRQQYTQSAGCSARRHIYNNIRRPKYTVLANVPTHLRQQTYNVYMLSVGRKTRSHSQHEYFMFVLAQTQRDDTSVRSVTFNGPCNTRCHNYCYGYLVRPGASYTCPGARTVLVARGLME